ncbi:hypothetical protein FCULG_00005009, partial [Fusarium culmorum]
SRCISHDRVCKYPARSNRGRKHGSTNKPDSVEKLLSRIEESGAKDEIIAALLGTGLPSPNRTVSCERLRSQMPMQPGVREAIMAPIKERLGAYFSSHRAQQKDWDVLAAQAVDCPFKLEKGTCDPLASRLIDESDATVYFQLFFSTRNPLVGLLDATLHTVDYVYANSFTLFSVICALGCAMSARPRDRAIYPVLMNLASGNVKWSIAAAVKSLATIQAIVNMQYWTPVSPTQVDDSSSISLSYAMQLAREMGISRSEVIREYVNAECESSPTENKGRCIRNFERTWLRTLIADKGFGIMNGKLHSVNWKEIPSSAAQWWKAPLAEPTDRMLSGIIEIRRLLATFYMDHSILVLNAQALRDLATAEDNTSSSSSEALLDIERKSIEVASRVLDLLSLDKTIIELALGFQNNQYLMICHVMTEAIKRGALTPEENSAAAGKVIGVIPLLDQIVQLLPATSAAHLYFDLARFFACQIDSLMGAPDLQEMRETIDTGMFTDDWFKAMDTGTPDVYTLLDMGYLGMDQPMMDTDDFMALNDFNSIT